MCTLVGTSTNLLVDSLARDARLPGFGLFEFTRLGLVFVAVGTCYLMLVQRWLLPDLGVQRRDGEERHGRFLVELLVPASSPAIGRRGSEVLPPETGDLTVLEIIRAGALVDSPRNELVVAGDRLLLRGDWQEIEQARRRLTPEEAYAAVDWRVVMLLAGVLPLGIALEQSGGAAWLAHHAIFATGDHGAVATLASIYLLTGLRCPGSLPRTTRSAPTGVENSSRRRTPPRPAAAWDRVPDQCHGLQRRRLSLLRFHACRGSAQPDLLGAGGHTDRCLLSVPSR